jgi:hypothetical protein
MINRRAWTHRPAGQKELGATGRVGQGSTRDADTQRHGQVEVHASARVQRRSGRRVATSPVLQGKGLVAGPFAHVCCTRHGPSHCPHGRRRMLLSGDVRWASLRLHVSEVVVVLCPPPNESTRAGALGAGLRRRRRTGAVHTECALTAIRVRTTSPSLSCRNAAFQQAPSHLPSSQPTRACQPALPACCDTRERSRLTRSFSTTPAFALCSWPSPISPAAAPCAQA